MDGVPLTFIVHHQVKNLNVRQDNTLVSDATRKTKDISVSLNLNCIFRAKQQMLASLDRKLKMLNMVNIIPAEHHSISIVTVNRALMPAGDIKLDSNCF